MKERVLRIMEDVGKRMESLHGIRVVRRGEEASLRAALVEARYKLGNLFIEEEGLPATTVGIEQQKQTQAFAEKFTSGLLRPHI